jgi:hypothetical protein
MENFMLLSARSRLKRVSIRFDPRTRPSTTAMTPEPDSSGGHSTVAVSPALALAREQISARPSEFVAARQQANGE